MKLNEAFRKWIEIHSLAISKATYDSYNSTYENHIRSSNLGDFELDVIDTTVASDFLKNLNVGEATLWQVRKTLRALYNYYIDEGVIAKNPFIKTKVRYKAPKARIMKQNEMQKFLDVNCANDMYPLFVLLSETGLRIGEGLGIAWDDIDFSKMVISIERQFSRGEIKNLKTDTSNRIVNISDLAIELLAMRRSKYPESKYVFENPKTGIPFSQVYVRQIFFDMLEKAGLPQMKLHSFRKYHATFLIENEISLKAIQERMGWSSPMMLLDIYAQVTSTEEEKIKNLLNKK